MVDLPAPVAPTKRHRLARRDAQVDAVEHGLAGVVAEADVAELDRALQIGGRSTASAASGTDGSVSSRSRSLVTAAWPCW